jgi:hypothetical protein
MPSRGSGSTDTFVCVNHSQSAYKMVGYETDILKTLLNFSNIDDFQQAFSKSIPSSNAFNT